MKIKHLDLDKFLQVMIDYIEYVVFNDIDIRQKFNLEGREEIKISLENKEEIRKGLRLIIDKCIQQEDIDIIEIYNKYLEENKK